MAEKSTWGKLAVKPAMGIAALHAPVGFPAALGPLPEAAFLTDLPTADAVVAFVLSLDELRLLLEDAAHALPGKTVVWVAYPKGRPKEEINRDSIWHVVEEFGLRPVSQVSLDEKWSAIRLKPGSV